MDKRVTRRQIIKHYKAHFGLQDIPYRYLGEGDKQTINWAYALIEDNTINPIKTGLDLTLLKLKLQIALNKETKESFSKWYDSIEK